MIRKICLAIALAMILSVIVLTTVSCTKKMVQNEPVSMTEPEVQKSPDRSPEVDEQDGQLLDRLRAEAAAREATETVFVNENIHFAFDSSVLSEQARQFLISMADYMHTNQGITITVEGHCDDRGTNAYNITLGERRAESVKRFLVDQGIGANRLNTVSYGEDRPLDLGHNEASWAENRRAQFVID